jgi:ribonuclease P protein component
VLPASTRVRRRVEFATALRGSRVRADSLVLHYGVLPPDAYVPPPRAAVIVSRAVGGAVVRNRVRRQLRHLLPPVLERMPSGAVLLVRALPSAAGQSSGVMAGALTKAYARLSIDGQGAA